MHLWKLQFKLKRFSSMSIAIRGTKVFSCSLEQIKPSTGYTFWFALAKDTRNINKQKFYLFWKKFFPDAGHRIWKLYYTTNPLLIALLGFAGQYYFRG